ncbi:MAG: Eco57I restriction-modification methylase domain-containing protein, partial [Gemmatimonadaceae bacterium]
QEFVERLTTLTLAPALTCARVSREMAESALSGCSVDDECRAVLLRRTAEMRILDPACGSGAFLVHTLERISLLRRTLGDMRPTAEIRRSVLTQSIYGVDINPTAVWLCELRLWLATVIESDERDPMRVVPLPNLDRQIRVGDSLAGQAFGSVVSPASAHPITRLRQRYTRATGQRKATLSRALDWAERQRAIEQLDRALTRGCAERLELLCSARATDLFDTRVAPGAHARERIARLRRTVRSLRARRLALARGAALPFSYAAHFADAADAGGFDVVIGNPPWIRIHNISVAARESYKESFETFRHAAWGQGASAAGAGTGFGGQSDTSALFLERSCELVRSGGSVGLLLPSKLWRSLAGGGIRQLVRERMHLAALEDYSEAPPSFDAAVYPSLLVAARSEVRGPHADTNAAVPTLTAGVQRGATVLRWPATPAALSLDDTAGSPWILVPPAVRAAFDRISAAGTPMARAACGRPWLGVKTGCNAAFVVQELSEEHDLAHVCSGDRIGTVEQVLLRPLVRGETLTRWTIARGDERIVWTHDAEDAPVRELPPHALKWLTRWRHTLERRSDAQRSRQWWSLFRTQSADRARARVVWNDFGRSPRAAVLMPGDATVPLNSCYVARCDSTYDAFTLTALINSPLAAAWLSILAEPARGGYHRYLGWTMATFPLPRHWPRACDILGPLTARAVAGDVPSRCELHDATLRSYGLPPDSVAPLMQWMGGE